MKDFLPDLATEMRQYVCLPYYKRNDEKRYLEFKLCNHELSWEEIITFVNIGLDYPYDTELSEVMSPDRLTVLVNKYRRLPVDYIPGDLEPIASDCSSGQLLLRYPARLAFEEMCRAAGKQGIRLEAISSFRSFVYQQQVYYQNWNEGTSLEQYQKERDRVSARPGHSEHQTGLVVDINDLEQTFETTPEGRWLAENAHCYGFLLRYPKGKEKITGYDYEPWHFRYLGKGLSETVYRSNLTYDEFYTRYLEPFHL